MVCSESDYVNLFQSLTIRRWYTVSFCLISAPSSLFLRTSLHTWLARFTGWRPSLTGLTLHILKYFAYCLVYFCMFAYCAYYFSVITHNRHQYTQQQQHIYRPRVVTFPMNEDTGLRISFRHRLLFCQTSFLPDMSMIFKFCMLCHMLKSGTWSMSGSADSGTPGIEEV